MAGKKKTMEMLKESWKPILESTDGKDLGSSHAPKKKGKWPHESKELLYGSVNYKGKHIGTKAVNQPDGKETVKAALYALIKETKNQSKFPEVDIAISVRSITVTEVKTSMHVCKNKLQNISFCTEENVMGSSYFCFIVRKGEGQFSCYCFSTQCSPHRINITVGQAFELAYERFQQAKDVSELFVTEMKKIKARKGREDYAKKLAEIHKYPSTDEFPSFQQEEDKDEDGGATPDEKRVKRLSSQWQHLSDTLQPLRDNDKTHPVLDMALTEDHLDSMMEGLTSELREWDGVKSPLKAGDVNDALKELDSALIPLSSDSTATLESDSTTHLSSLPPTNTQTEDVDNEITFL